jgi:hypothetical protein
VRVVFILLIALNAFAQKYKSSGQSGYIGQTQERRQTQRVSIYDWIMANKKAISDQNAKYGLGSKVLAGPYPDLVLQYRSDHTFVRRGSTNLGEDDRGTAKIQFLLDDLIMGGDKTRSYSIDLGIEGFYSKSGNFKAADGITQVSHTYTETGGGLLIRPFGRSSQDTGFLVKGGYIDVDYSGLWENSDTLKKVWGFYFGAEGKLYLLPFLGIYGDYMVTTVQNIEGLGGKWGMYRLMYGAFIEVFLLNIHAYIIDSEYDFTPENSAKIKETFKGVGFGAILHF